MTLGYGRHIIACSVVNESRAITLHLLGTDKYETSGAHLQMLVNIPVKFYDSGSKAFGHLKHTSRFWADGQTDKGKSICPHFQTEWGHKNHPIFH